MGDFFLRQIPVLISLVAAWMWYVIWVMSLRAFGIPMPLRPGQRHAVLRQWSLYRHEFFYGLLLWGIGLSIFDISNAYLLRLFGIHHSNPSLGEISFKVFLYALVGLWIGRNSYKGANWAKSSGFTLLNLNESTIMPPVGSAK